MAPFPPALRWRPECRPIITIGPAVDAGVFESPFPVGARDALAAKPLGLSPKPAAGYLRLELPQPAQLELLDARGRLVRQLAMRGGGERVRREVCQTIGSVS